MKEIVTIKGQTVDDLAIVHYGSADGALQILLDNPGVNLSDDIPSGTTILVDETKVIDKKTVEFYAKDDVILPATQSNITE